MPDEWITRQEARLLLGYRTDWAVTKQVRAGKLRTSAAPQPQPRPEGRPRQYLVSRADVETLRNERRARLAAATARLEG